MGIRKDKNELAFGAAEPQSTESAVVLDMTNDSDILAGVDQLAAGEKPPEGIVAKIKNKLQQRAERSVVEVNGITMSHAASQLVNEGCEYLGCEHLQFAVSHPAAGLIERVPWNHILHQGNPSVRKEVAMYEYLRRPKAEDGFPAILRIANGRSDSVLCIGHTPSESLLARLRRNPEETPAPAGTT